MLTTCFRRRSRRLNEVQLLVEAEKVEDVLEERPPAFGVLALRLSGQIARKREPRRELRLDAQRLVGLAIEAMKRDRETRVRICQKADDHQSVSSGAAESVGVLFSNSPLVLHVANAKL